MASWPSDSVRTKNWGTETLTDVDLEAQLDVLHSWVNDALDETSGHKHDGTSNEGPKIDTGGIAADAIENAQIADNAVKAENIELQNTSPLVGRNAADTGDVPLISADANDEVLMGNGVVLPEVNVPVTGVNQGAVYVKNDGTQTELFFGEESAGDEVQITKGGAVKGVSDATLDIEDYGTSGSTGTAKTPGNVFIRYGRISVGAQTTVTLTNLPFASTSSYVVVITPEKVYGNSVFGSVIEKVSGSSVKIGNSLASITTIGWYAIGT